MIKNIINICFVALLIITASCRDSVKSTTPEANANLNKSELRLKKKLEILKDSLNSNWQRMEESDQLKMATIKRLLDEISYTPKFNAISQRQLIQQHARVKQLQYTMQSMAKSELIDKYDFAQDSLVNSVIDLAVQTPGSEQFPLISELTNDIQTEQNKRIFFRIRHDEVGREINKLLKENRKKVARIGSPFPELEKIPLFSLSGT